MLDLTSSLYYSLILYITGFGIILVIYKQYRKNMNEFQYLLIMYGLNATGVSLAITRTDVGIFWGIIVGNLLIFSASIHLFLAIIKRFDKRNNPILLTFLIILFIILFYYFTYVDISVSMRIIIASVFLVFIHGLIIIKLKDDYHNNQVKFILLINILALLNYSMRIVTTTLNSFDSLSFFDYSYDAFNVFMMAVFNISILFGLIASYYSKMHEYFLEIHKQARSLYDIFKIIPAPSIIMTQKGEISLYNESFKRYFGHENGIPTHINDLIGGEFDELCKTKLSKEQSVQIVECDITTNGKIVPFDVVINKTTEETPMLFLTFIDKSQLLATNEVLNEYKEMLERTKSSTSIGFWELDIEQKSIYADQYARAIYDMFDKTESIPLIDVQQIVVEKYRKTMDVALQQLIENGTPYDVTFEIITKNNVRKHIHSKAYLSFHNMTKKILGTIQDITPFISLQEETEYLKKYDQLTSLLNRESFEELLSIPLTKAQLPVSVIITDFNRLSDINQSFGYEQGNDALKISAMVMKECISEQDRIARIGEDEFGILLYNTNRTQAKTLISAMEEALSKKYIKNHEYKLSWTFGSSSTNTVSTSLLNVYKSSKTDMQKHKSYIGETTHLKSIDAIIQTLNEKDPYSEIHSQRVAYFAKKLAVKMSLSKTKVHEIETAALLHDIGKILTSNDILLSSKQLTPQEYEEIKKHPLSGYNILSAIPEFKDISKIILAHHERIDGSGYPYGIKGTTIPYESKIIAIADAYDAMTGRRLYKKSYLKEEAILELLHNRGTQFDEELVNAFVDVISKSENDVAK